MDIDAVEILETQGIGVKMGHEPKDDGCIWVELIGCYLFMVERDIIGGSKKKFGCCRIKLFDLLPIGERRAVERHPQQMREW